MSDSISLSAVSPPERSLAKKLDNIFGPAMFFVSVVALLLAAGAIHRFDHALGPVEAAILRWGIVVVWPLIVLEGLLRLALAQRTTSWRWRLATFAGVCLMPPFRLAGRACADPAKIWLPFVGWSKADQLLRTRLERFISVPMLVVALMILPFLALELFWLETVRASFLLSLVLDIGTAVIWVAFAAEFIVMASLAEDRIDYCLRHWIDLAIVALPLVDCLPILRLLRLAELLEAGQLGRLGRLYRWRGLLAKLWRAVLLLEMIQRLLGHRRETQLGGLKRLLAARQEEIADLTKAIRELEGQLVSAKPTTAAEPGNVPPADEQQTPMACGAGI